MPRVIVAGLGAAGAATAWQLATRGYAVVGLDRWTPPHPHGSSHGDTRVTRATAWEGAAYVPLARRAHELWDRLEHETGQVLRERVGALFIGRAHETIVAGTRRAAAETGVEARDLTDKALRTMVPGIRTEPEAAALFDPGGGVLRLEPCLRAMLARAVAHGADLRVGERLLRWEATDTGVDVQTDRGTYDGDALVLAMGAWMGPQLAGLGFPLVVERQTMHWFEAPDAADADRPVLVASDGQDHATVIFPARDGLVKVAGHGSAEVATDPAGIDRDVRDSDTAAAAAALDRWLPGRRGAQRHALTCLYTRTPNGQFLLDRHPVHPQVVCASPCNGFGFKFAPAVGELLAALAVGDTPPLWSPGWRFPQR